MGAAISVIFNGINNLINGVGIFFESKFRTFFNSTIFVKLNCVFKKYIDNQRVFKLDEVWIQFSKQ